MGKLFARSLFTLDCGSIIVDKGGVLTDNIDAGEKVEVPMHAFLIKSEKENLLFDAGIDFDDRELLAAFGTNIKIKEEDFLLNRLREIGVSPDEVNYVFISHLHFDHSGVLRHFKKAKIFIQRQEYGFAINPPSFTVGLYRPHYYNSPDLAWHILDGDEVLLPGVMAFSTPGHTPGHQSLMVNMISGETLIITGDCAYLGENIKKEIIPGLFTDPFQALHSLKKIKMLAQITHAQIMFSHSKDNIPM